MSDTMTTSTTNGASPALKAKLARQDAEKAVEQAEKAYDTALARQTRAAQRFNETKAETDAAADALELAETALRKARQDERRTATAIDDGKGK